MLPCDTPPFINQHSAVYFWIFPKHSWRERGGEQQIDTEEKAQTVMGVERQRRKTQVGNSQPGRAGKRRVGGPLHGERTEEGPSVWAQGGGVNCAWAGGQKGCLGAKGEELEISRDLRKCWHMLSEDEQSLYAVLRLCLSRHRFIYHSLQERSSSGKGEGPQGKPVLLQGAKRMQSVP